MKNDIEWHGDPQEKWRRLEAALRDHGIDRDSVTILALGSVRWGTNMWGQPMYSNRRWVVGGPPTGRNPGIAFGDERDVDKFIIVIDTYVPRTKSG